VADSHELVDYSALALPTVSGATPGGGDLGVGAGVGLVVVALGLGARAAGRAPARWASCRHGIRGGFVRFENLMLPGGARVRHAVNAAVGVGGLGYVTVLTVVLR
jgi:hypothetical protein